MTIPPGTITAASINTDFNAIYTSLTGDARTGRDFEVDVTADGLTSSTPRRGWVFFTSPDDFQVMAATLMSVSTTTLSTTVGLTLVEFDPGTQSPGDAVIPDGVVGHTTYSTAEAIGRVAFGNGRLLRKGVYYRLSVYTSDHDLVTGKASIVLRSRRRTA